MYVTFVYYLALYIHCTIGQIHENEHTCETLLLLTVEAVIDAAGAILLPDVKTTPATLVELTGAAAVLLENIGIEKLVLVAGAAALGGVLGCFTAKPVAKFVWKQSKQ